jgi:hypothetical protein
MYNTQEKKREYEHNWYKAHPTYNAERNRRDRARIRKEIIVLYGGKCQKCGYDKDDRALQIDHIDGVPEIAKTRWHRGGVGLYRAILRGDYPKTLFQLLCANCNIIKKFENKEYAKRPFKYVS